MAPAVPKAIPGTCQLTAKLEEGVPACPRQGARIERRAHRAARLSLVAAVRESAVSSELVHVREEQIDRLVVEPELDLAQARGVNDHSRARDFNQLTCRGDVPSTSIPVPDRPNLERIRGEQRVDQARLADTRGSEQHGRAPWFDQRLDLLQPGTQDGAGHENRYI